jgi:hypothetical protein
MTRNPPDPVAQARLQERLRARGATANDGPLSRVATRIEDAHRVLVLANDDGYFDDMGNHTRVREAALDILADQYPELDVEIRTRNGGGGGFGIARRWDEKDAELRRRMRLFRVFNRGTER